jgi:transposase
MAGRKLKLTPAVQDRIVQALGVGATHEHACQYAGISRACLYHWLRLGATGRAPYAAFAAAVSQAEARAVVGWLAQIDAAARNGQWAAAAWFLERKYPQIYGRQRVYADGEAAQPVTITVQYAESARERLDARLGHLSHRHTEDAMPEA